MATDDADFICGYPRQSMASFLLLRRLLMLERVAGLYNGGRIDRDVSFVDVANDAFFVDQESSAISKALLLVKDAIRFHDGAFEVAE